MIGEYAIPATQQTARLLLRPIALGDAADIFAYCSDPLVTRHVPWPTHRTIDDAIDFVNRRLKLAASGPVLDWSISQGEGKPMIGWIGIEDIRDAHFSGEVGYVLARPFWKCGFMTEALRTVVDTTFRHTPINRIHAQCLVANRASARVMEKSGMTFEGVLREVNYFKNAFHDLQSWAILRKDWLAATRR
jgi:ribosomal-protein-alanine N-acetyltransferase